MYKTRIVNYRVRPIRKQHKQRINIHENRRMCVFEVDQPCIRYGCQPHREKKRKEPSKCRKSTLCRILHQKEKIESQCNTGHGNAVRTRPSKCPELEKCLLEWIRHCEEDEVPINGPIIKDQALRFAAMLGVTDFKASNGWLEGFKNRFGVGKTQVSNLLKDRESVLKDWRENGMGGSMKKRMRKGSADVDAFVYEWFRNALAQNIPVGGPLIQEKALEVAKALGNPDFKASNGWLCKFKSRHGINWRLSSGEIPDPAFGGASDLAGPSADYGGASAEYGEASVGCCGGSAEYGEASADSARAEELPLQPAVDWRSVLRNWCTGYSDCDIYNCVETSLLFGALPNQVMFNPGEKTAKQRLTILLCANVAGDFEEPMIIGNTLPKQMEHLRLRDLGFSWKVNQYSWMSPEVMNEWLDSLNLRMMVQKRNIIMILEDSKCHPHVDLSNVKLVFLPPNARQPLDAGVVRSFKRHYRTKLLRHLLCNKQPCVSKLDAAMWIVSVIKDIKPAEVRKCFSEVGICEVKPDQPAADSKPELDNLVQMLSSDLSAEDYITSDNHLPTSYSETDIQSIIETIKSSEEDDQADKETPNPKPENPPPDHKTALENLKLVETLLLHDKNASLYQKIYSVRLEMEKTYTAKNLLQNKNQVFSNLGHFNMTLSDNECCYEFVEALNSANEQRSE